MPKEFPDSALLDRVIKELSEVGTQEVRMTGGEACLYPGFFEAVHKIAERGIGVSVITNGTLFAKKYIDHTLKAPLERIVLSLDTPHPEKHNEIRVIQNLFETGTEGIHALRKARGEVGLEINMVVSNQTVADIEAAVRFADQMKADYLNLIPIKDWPEMEVSVEQMRAHNEQRGKLMELAQALGVHVAPPDFNLFGLNEQELVSSHQGIYPGRNGCYVPYREAFIDLITGLVWPCDSTPYADRNCNTCGSLHEETFPEIWFGDRYNKLRRAFRRAKPVPCSHKCDPANGCNSDMYRLEIENLIAASQV